MGTGIIRWAGANGSLAWMSHFPPRTRATSLLIADLTGIAVEGCLYVLLCAILFSQLTRDAVSLVLLVLLAWRRVVAPDTRPPISPLVLFAIILFLVATGLAAAASEYHGESLLNLRFYPLGLLVFLAARDVVLERGPERLSAFLLFGLAVLAADVLWQFAYGTSALRGYSPVADRFMGSLMHPTDVSLLPILLPLTFPALTMSGGLRRLTGVVAVFLIAAAVILSGTRAAWGALCLALLGIGWVLGRNRLSLRVAVATVALSIGLAVVAANSAPRRLLSPASYSGDQRILQWQASLRLFREAPWIGHGPHTFQRLSSERRNQGEPIFRRIDPLSAPYPHSLYLEMLVGSGIIGLGGFLFLLCQPWLSLLRSTTPSVPARAAAASCLLFGIVGLVDLCLIKDWVHVALWLPVAISSAASPAAPGEGGQ